MKKYFLSMLMFISCAQANDSPVQWDADTHNYAPYAGKTVLNINYCDGCGSAGDLLIITFTDGTKLKVYAYKYTMSIWKK